MYKIIDDLCQPILSKLNSFSVRRLWQICFGILSLAILILSMILVQVYLKSSYTLSRITAMSKQFVKARELLQRKTDLDASTDQIGQMLNEQTTKLNLAAILDQAVAQTAVELDTGWKDKIKTVNFEYAETLQQEVITLFIAKLRVQQFVDLLNHLRKFPQIQIKELEVRNKNDSLSLQILLHAYKLKA